MDGLRRRFAEARKAPKTKRREVIHAFHQEIGRLKFLDPACGCGNFLVVAYRELRKLEDDIIAELFAEGQLLDISTMQQCHIGQFYGIEIDEYPAQIAKVAMWLTDHQCNRRTSDRFGDTRPSIPLTDSAEIINANALQTEWPEADYIFGNPPFIGSSLQNKEQKADTQSICGAFKGCGVLDYVCNWYVKAAAIMQAAPNVQTAFVSTNSICQGEQVEVLWGNLIKQGMQINFAHRTFQWTSAVAGKAAVHCVIVGFSADLSERSEAQISCNSELQQRAATASCNSELQQRAATASCNSELQQRAATASCNSELQQRAATASCNSELQQRAATASCNSEISVQLYGYQRAA
ncbi:N-6 DNA methylase [Neisseria sp. Dent CA1/247]|nr:DNA methyltransferase [Neisseria sp. Dent CA1/247]UOO78220.1 N-6 DNA methylase [Neisseria sp. Dent CA1/247]